MTVADAYIRVLPAALADIKHDRAIDHSHGVAAKVDDSRDALRLSRGEVEPAIVFWALDRGPLNETVGQMNVGVGALTIGRKDAIVKCAIDRICPGSVVETDDVVLLNLIELADLHPMLAHWGTVTGSRELGHR